MVNKFSKKELQRLVCTDEEIDLVITYQKLLPMPSEDFEMDARTLHDYLGVGKKVTTWIQGRISKYGFCIGVDYKIVYSSSSPNFGNADFSTLSQAERSALGIKTNYLLTVNMCKELCTIENNDLGRLARRYFILMEDILVRNKEWIETRSPERKEYKDMCEMLSANIYKHNARPADKYDYSREANIINIIATGSEAQEIRNYFGLNNTNELTRDSLERDYNEKLAFLQKQNIIYLGLDLPIVERVKMLIASFDVIYPTASPVLPWLSREDMLKARDELIEKLSC